MSVSFDFNKPVTTDQYLSILTMIRNAQIGIASMLDPNYVTTTNAVSGTKRYNPATLSIEQYNGSSWVPVSGAIRYNTSTSRLERYGSSGWEEAGAFLQKSGGTMTGTLNDKQGYPVYGVPNTPEAHNCLYRGKEHTVEGLSAKVLANDFSDIFIGDYFKVSFSTAYGTVSNQKVLVAGINYFKNCGDSATPTPHLVMIPETSFGSAAMNATNTTEGAYAGSAMHTTVLPAIATALKTAIGSSHVVSTKLRLAFQMTSSTPSMAGAGHTGASTDWTYQSCDLCLMSEPMVYGGMIWSSSAFDVGERKTILPIFLLNNGASNTRQLWWLSSVVNQTRFARCNDWGDAKYDDATSVNKVRPFFVFR